MSFLNLSEPRAILLKQYGLVAVILLILFFATWFTFFRQSVEDRVIDYSKLKLKDLSKVDDALLEDRWLEQSETKMNEQEAKIRELEEALAKLTADNKKHQTEQEALINNAKTTLDGYAQTVEHLQTQLQTIQTPATPDPLSSPRVATRDDNYTTFTPAQPDSPADATRLNQSFEETHTMQSFDIDLVDTASDALTTENYLPPGAYAPARIISGADTSTSVNAQGDARQILLRIQGPALSAHHQGDPLIIPAVEGCTVTAFVRGDLSSEKGYVRLKEMTCAKNQREFTVTAVKGYAANKGKAGVRGPVVSREGDLVEKSFWSGVVGSFGQGVESKFQNTTASAFGTLTSSTEDQSTKDILKSGFGAGVGRSAETLSQYYIRRAEQYQPVIPINAGITVELVFIEGVFLDGREHKKTAKNQPEPGNNAS